MRLEPSERETIILFSDADDTASVYTFDKKLKARLKELHRRQPDKIYPDSKGRSGSACFIVPKNCISIREPYSEERRRAASERAKQAGYKPPVRGTTPNPNKLHAPARIPMSPQGRTICRDISPGKERIWQKSSPIRTGSKRSPTTLKRNSGAVSE